MGSLVIAVYRPKRGKSKSLLELVRTHVPTLRRLGLVTGRAPIVGKAEDGSIVEIFEWISAEAIDRAHHDPAVQRLWKRFNAVSEYRSLDSLGESKRPFPALEPIDLGPAVGAIEWVDTTVRDARGLRRFYERVVGYDVLPLSMGEYEDYCMIASDGRIVSGVCHARGENADVPPGWLPYLMVENLTRSVAAARKLGGTLVGAVRSGSGGKVAIVRDPSGSHAALFQRTPERRTAKVSAAPAKRKGAAAAGKRTASRTSARARGSSRRTRSD